MREYERDFALQRLPVSDADAHTSTHSSADSCAYSSAYSSAHRSTDCCSDSFPNGSTDCCSDSFPNGRPHCFADTGTDVRSGRLRRWQLVRFLELHVDLWRRAHVATSND